MPGPMTIVTLLDEDGDEFPVVLPGVYRENRAADAEAALLIIAELTEVRPRGELRLGGIEYRGS